MLNIYIVPCLLEILLLHYLLLHLDRDVLEYNLEVEDRRLSYELYSMMGNKEGGENTILSIKDGNMFQRLTGLGLNKTMINEKLSLGEETSSIKQSRKFFNLRGDLSIDMNRSGNDLNSSNSIIKKFGLSTKNIQNSYRVDKTMLDNTNVINEDE